MYIEIFGKECKYQIDRQLCDKIHYYQKTKQCIRQSIHFSECQKQKRRQIRRYRHCNTCKVACFLCKSVLFHVIFSFHASASPQKNNDIGVILGQMQLLRISFSRVSPSATYTVAIFFISSCP